MDSTSEATGMPSVGTELAVFKKARVSVSFCEEPLRRKRSYHIEYGGWGWREMGSGFLFINAKQKCSHLGFSHFLNFFMIFLGRKMEKFALVSLETPYQKQRKCSVLQRKSEKCELRHFSNFDLKKYHENLKNKNFQHDCFFVSIW